MVGIDICEAMVAERVELLIHTEMPNKDQSLDVGSGLFDSHVCHLSTDPHFGGVSGHIWGLGGLEGLRSSPGRGTS